MRVKFTPYIKGSKASLAADALEKSRECNKDSHLTWEPVRVDGRDARAEVHHLNRLGYEVRVT
jgi:hypothetical protein